ncbi:MAG TPA: M3 family oligoendopeptidase [Pirellulaceae bacterium]|nr:M3 family oligoendopeptidase [Pirellulaceae bacterium]
MSTVDFHAITAPTPQFDTVAAEYAAIHADLDAAQQVASEIAAINRWDTLRRQLETWEALVQLRFNQDTKNEAYKQARDYCDELRPKLTELAVAMKRRLLASPRRAELEAHFGPQAFALWKASITTYDPIIEVDMVREAKLEAEYVELTADVKLLFQGEELNLSSIVKYREHPDRAIRHEAERLRWGWYAENRATLDRIFDDQVKLRTSMAKKLGFDNYIGLAYQRMSRVDYNQHDVERFRAAVREYVVPLGVELRRRQAAKLGIDPLMYWDDGLYDPAGNPKPQGDHDWMIVQAQAMYDEMGYGLDSFFRLMVDGHLMDLKTRENKAGGGFCTSFPTYGVPYVYANFNGTKGDVEVLTHEIGHAFQGYMSRAQPLADYLWPTYESCEIHSMGLEFLSLPWVDKFFGAEGGERFRRLHLELSLLFLPYGVAVDHFQHLVYAKPEASPDERHAMWQEVEKIYLPWRNYGDLPHVATGGFWQFQRHIYLNPFYYIDYTLAQTCALQFWVRATNNYSEAMDAYVKLCQRGGEAPFQQLARGAGLISPFDEGCLRDVVAQAKTVLGM